MLTHSECKGRRHRVPNLPRNRVFVRGLKHVPFRKSLKGRSFSQRNSPILGGVSEPTVGEAVEPRRDRGGRTIPIHPRINVSKYPVLSLVSGDLKFRIVPPTFPRAAVLGRLRDSPLVVGRKFRGGVKE